MQGSWVQFLVWKLRSHMPCSMTKNKQLKNDQSLSFPPASSSPGHGSSGFQSQVLAAGLGAVGGGSGRVSGVFIFSVQSFLQVASSALIPSSFVDVAQGGVTSD